MHLPSLIGLSGKAKSGKTLVASYLQGQGYYALAFADALKEVAGIAFDLSQEQLHGDLKEVPDPRFGKSPRWLFQHLGSDVCGAIWPEIWINHVAQALAELRAQGRRLIVVTDMRLLKEAAWIKAQGGFLLRLERPGNPGAQNGIAEHSSETELDDYPGWDAVLRNGGGVEALLLQVAAVISNGGTGAGS